MKVSQRQGRGSQLEKCGVLPPGYGCVSISSRALQVSQDLVNKWWQIGASSAVMRVPHQFVVLKRKLSIFGPSMFQSNEIWVVTKRIGWWIQAAEMSFFQRWVAIRRKLRVEPLLLGWCGLGLLVASLWRFFWHVLLGGGPGADLYIPPGLGMPRDPPGEAGERR